MPTQHSLFFEAQRKKGGKIKKEKKNLVRKKSQMRPWWMTQFIT